MHTRTHAHTHMHAHMHTRTRMHTRTHAHTHTHTHTHTHSDSLAYLTAATHGLTEEAASIAETLSTQLDKVPVLSSSDAYPLSFQLAL